MKRSGILGLIFSAILLCGSICSAQEDSYKNKIDTMVADLVSLDILLQSNEIDYSSYDKWYKDFQNISEGFVKDFSRLHKQEKSFQLVKEGLNGFSLGWGMLNQAKYAEDQFKESLTLNDASGAQKWKNTANNNRKKAIDTISHASESIIMASQACLNGE
jgi:hypothetical protein